MTLQHLQLRDGSKIRCPLSKKSKMKWWRIYNCTGKTDRKDWCIAWAVLSILLIGDCRESLIYDLYRRIAFFPFPEAHMRRNFFCRSRFYIVSACLNSFLFRMLLKYQIALVSRNFLFHTGRFYGFHRCHKFPPKSIIIWLGMNQAVLLMYTAWVIIGQKLLLCFILCSLLTVFSFWCLRIEFWELLNDCCWIDIL